MDFLGSLVLENGNGNGLSGIRRPRQTLLVIVVVLSLALGSLLACNAVEVDPFRFSVPSTTHHQKDAVLAFPLASRIVLEEADAAFFPPQSQSQPQPRRRHVLGFWNNLKDKITDLWSSFVTSDLIQSVGAKIQSIFTDTFSDLDPEFFLGRVGNALDSLADDLAVDFEVDDLVDTLLDGLGNLTSTSVFTAYMDNVEELADMNYGLVMLDSVINGTVEKLNDVKDTVEDVVEDLNLDLSGLEALGNEVVSKFRLKQGKKYFLQAVKRDIRKTFDKADDALELIGDTFEDIGDKLENVTLEALEVGEEALVSIKGIAHTAFEEIKNATKLDVDVDEMLGKVLEKIRQVDVTMENFGGSIGIWHYVVDLVKENGLQIDAILHDAITDVVDDILSDNSTVAAILGDLSPGLANKVDMLVEAVKGPDGAGAVKVWPKLRLLSSWFGVDTTLFREDYPDQVPQMTEAFQDYEAYESTEGSPMNAPNFLESVLEVVLGRKQSRPVYVVKCVAGHWPSCISLLVDLVVNAKGLKLSDLLNLAVDSVGLLFKGSEIYDVPIPVKPGNYLERANVVYLLKVVGSKLRDGLDKQEVQALVTALASKSNVPASKYFVSNIQYKAKSTFALEGVDYDVLVNSDAKKENTKKAFKDALGLPDSVVVDMNINSNSNRRSMLSSPSSSSGSTVVEFTATVEVEDENVLESVAAKHAQGEVSDDFTIELQKSEETEGFSAVKSGDFDLSADVQFSTESVDVSSSLYGNGASEEPVLLSVVPSDLNGLLEDAGVYGLGVASSSSRVANEGVVRKEDATRYEYLSTTTGKGKGSSGLDRTVVISVVAGTTAVFLSLVAYKMYDVGVFGHKGKRLGDEQLAGPLRSTVTYKTNMIAEDKDFTSFRGSAGSSGGFVPQSSPGYPLPVDDVTQIQAHVTCSSFSYSSSPPPPPPPASAPAQGNAKRVMNPVFVV